MYMAIWYEVIIRTISPEMFEDTKGVIRNGKSKDRQLNIRNK